VLRAIYASIQLIAEQPLSYQRTDEYPRARGASLSL